MFGVISGSGFYDIPGLVIRETRTVETPFGDPSSPYHIGELSGRELAFLPRHGARHNIPPHRINYRANMRGFHELGVRRVVSIGASGGIAPDLSAGSIVLLNQLIDLTSGRISTYFDGDDVVHIDFTDPFCGDLRQHILVAARTEGTSIREKGTYVCTNGPRLETAAEIRFFEKMGGQVVGMTAMPEASLARELGICYAGISVVTNPAAGVSGTRLTVKEVVETMKASSDKLTQLLRAFFLRTFEAPGCSCRLALDDARV